MQAFRVEVMAAEKVDDLLPPKHWRPRVPKGGGR
jgi:hypothetical protein